MCVWCAVLMLMGVVPLAQAERYLSVTEAQKVCFPVADRFENRAVDLTAVQMKSIESRAKSKFLHKTVPVWFARSGTNVLGVMIVDQVFGKHELIDYAVAIGPDGKVRQVEILEYREKYGGEIRKNEWREQFRGKGSGATLKLHDDVYNISGATISCRHVTEGLKRLLFFFEEFIRPVLGSKHRLPEPAADP